LASLILPWTNENLRPTFEQKACSFQHLERRDPPGRQAIAQTWTVCGKGIAVEKSVRLASATLCIVATFLIAGSASTADPPDPVERPAPTSIHPPQTKADITVFADGFESGDTREWSNGTANTSCQTLLDMPTGLAE
jgi:hypothetical protein